MLYELGEIFDLQMGKTPSRNNLSYWDTKENIYSNEAIMAFRDKHVTELLPEYIYYLFRYKDWSVGTNKEVMGKTLNKATLSQMKIDVCPIQKQREVVELAK